MSETKIEKKFRLSTEHAAAAYAYDKVTELLEVEPALTGAQVQELLRLDRDERRAEYDAARSPQ